MKLSVFNSRVRQRGDVPTAPLQGTSTSALKQGRVSLVILLGLYVAAAISHAWLAPTGQTGYQDAPDEAAHVNYARILAAGHLPTPHDVDKRWQSYEWHQPPLYYGMVAAVLFIGPRGMRCVSIVCGVVAIALIYITTLVLFPQESEIAVLAAGVAALIPGHIAITSTVNNDALLEVFFGAALLALVISLHHGFTTSRAAWLGAALGGAILTKATGFLLAPIVLLAIPLLRRSGNTWSALLRGFATCFMVCVVICAWWLVRNAVLYHELVPIHAFQAAFSGTVQAEDMARYLGGWTAYWSKVAVDTFQSFWAVYGTPRYAAMGGKPAFLPSAVYQLMAVVCVIATIGIARLHFARGKFSTAQCFSLWLMFAVFAVVCCSFAAFLAHYFQTQGRYLYPAMSPICIAIAIGWRNMFPVKYRNLASWLLLCLLALLVLLYLSTVQAAVP